MERTQSVQNTINERHAKKLRNLQIEYNSTTIDKTNGVVNISTKPLSNAQHKILEKGPKFSITPTTIPYKNIIAEVEAAIKNLPQESQDLVRSSTSSILEKSHLPAHNTTIEDLKNGKTRIIMKADKENCFVVMDRRE